MKKKTVSILLGMTMLAVSFAGCGKNEATEAANESAQTEKEGSGEDEELEKSEKEKEEKEKKEEASEEKTDKTVSEEEKSSEEEKPSEKETETENSEEETDEEVEEPAQVVTVFLPDQEKKQWTTDGEELKTELEANGYEAVVEYAEGDASGQADQIRKAMEEETEAMIIVPVDAYSLTDVLTEVKEKGIPVFSYEELIMDTDAVNYYVAFDRRRAGQMIAEEIVNRMDLGKAQEEKQSYHIEFAMGSLDDTAALFLYNGIMEVLQPYLDDGTLVCKSGQMTFQDTGTLRWDGRTAKNRLAGILEEFYQEDTLDIVCTGFDEAACSAQEALEEAGLLPGSEEWPLITGVGSEAEAIKDIAGNRMAFTLFMDREVLAQECVKMVDTYLKGDKPEVNDYEQYDNGVKIIGTFACEPHVIDKDNYELLIDKGYYTEEEVRPEALPTMTPTPVEEKTVTPTPAEEEKMTGTPTPEAEEETPTTTPKEEKDTVTPTPKEEKAVTPTPEGHTTSL